MIPQPTATVAAGDYTAAQLIKMAQALAGADMVRSLIDGPPGPLVTRSFQVRAAATQGVQAVDIVAEVLRGLTPAYARATIAYFAEAYRP